MDTWKIMTLGSFPVESGSTNIGLGLIWSFLCHLCANGFWCQSNILSFVLWLQEQFFSTIFVSSFPSLWVLCPLAKPTAFLFSSSHFLEGLSCGPEIGPFQCSHSCQLPGGGSKRAVCKSGVTLVAALSFVTDSEIFPHHPGRFPWLSETRASLHLYKLQSTCPVK